MVQFPQGNLPTDSMRWGRAVEAAINALERGVSSLTNRGDNTSSSSSSSLAKIGSQISELRAIQDDMKATQDTLVAAGRVAQSESQPNATVIPGFYEGSGRPEVTITSPSGKIDVQFGGSLNSGNGVFVISVVGLNTGTVYVNRDSMVNNYAQRLAMSGGANFTPSAYRSMVVNVSSSEPVRVRLEVNAFTNGLYFVGGSVLARATL